MRRRAGAKAWRETRQVLQCCRQPARTKLPSVPLLRRREVEDGGCWARGLCLLGRLPSSQIHFAMEEELGRSQRVKASPLPSSHHRPTLSHTLPTPTCSRCSNPQRTAPPR